jgi:hypothetical protein
MTPQNTNNNILEDLRKSEANESPVADIITMIRMFDELNEELKKDTKNSSMNSKIIWTKNSRRHKNN